MCGIVGLFNYRENTIDLATSMIVSQDRRGTDATGIAYITNNGIEIQKKAITPKEFKEQVEEKETFFLIGHNRNATTNTYHKEEDTEAHPFISENKEFAIVHNGHINYYKEWGKLLNLMKHNFSSGVDSEVLVHILEELLLRYSDRDEAMKQFFKVAKGENVLVLFEDKTLYGFPGTNSFKVSNDKESIGIASSYEGLYPYLVSNNNKKRGYQPQNTEGNMLKIYLNDDELVVERYGDWRSGIFHKDKFTMFSFTICDFCREKKPCESIKIKNRTYDRCYDCRKANKTEPKKTYTNVYPSIRSMQPIKKVDIPIKDHNKIHAICEQCDKFFTLYRCIYCKWCDSVLCYTCFHDSRKHPCKQKRFSYVS